MWNSKIQNDCQGKQRVEVYPQRCIEDPVITVSMTEFFVKIFNSF